MKGAKRGPKDIVQLPHYVTPMDVCFKAQSDWYISSFQTGSTRTANNLSTTSIGDGSSQGACNLQNLGYTIKLSTLNDSDCYQSTYQGHD